MKYQIAENGYKDCKMFPGGLRYILDLFNTKQEDEMAIDAMLRQAVEDGYNDSRDGYVIIEVQS